MVQTSGRGSLHEVGPPESLIEPPSVGAPTHASKRAATQTLTLPQPATGRYLRLVARSEQAGQHFASLAELEVIAVEKR